MSHNAGNTSSRKHAARGQSTNKCPYSDEDVRIVQEVMLSKNYYDMLGISRFASEADVTRAFRKRARKLHPDKNRAPGAEEAFKLMNNAYGTLKNVVKRGQYDRSNKFSTKADSNKQQDTRGGSTSSAGNSKNRPGASTGNSESRSSASASGSKSKPSASSSGRTRRPYGSAGDPNGSAGRPESKTDPPPGGHKSRPYGSAGDPSGSAGRPNGSAKGSNGFTGGSKGEPKASDSGRKSRPNDFAGDPNGSAGSSNGFAGAKASDSGRKSRPYGSAADPSGSAGGPNGSAKSSPGFTGGPKGEPKASDSGRRRRRPYGFTGDPNSSAGSSNASSDGPRASSDDAKRKSEPSAGCPDSTSDGSAGRSNGFASDSHGSAGGSHGSAGGSQGSARGPNTSANDWKSNLRAFADRMRSWLNGFVGGENAEFNFASVGSWQSKLGSFAGEARSWLGDLAGGERLRFLLASIGSWLNTIVNCMRSLTSSTLKYFLPLLLLLVLNLVVLREKSSFSLHSSPSFPREFSTQAFDIYPGIPFYVSQSFAHDLSESPISRRIIEQDVQKAFVADLSQKCDTDKKTPRRNRNGGKHLPQSCIDLHMCKDFIAHQEKLQAQFSLHKTSRFYISHKTREPDVYQNIQYFVPLDVHKSWKKDPGARKHVERRVQQVYERDLEETCFEAKKKKVFKDLSRCDQLQNVRSFIEEQPNSFFLPSAVLVGLSMAGSAFASLWQGDRQ